MICPNCGTEMRKGYLFGSKDGAFSFAKEVPSAFTQARSAEGFAALTGLKIGGRTSMKACLCDACRIVIVRYEESVEG